MSTPRLVPSCLARASRVRRASAIRFSFSGFASPASPSSTLASRQYETSLIAITRPRICTSHTITARSRHFTPSLLARRSFSQSTARRHGHLDKPAPGEELNVTIVDQADQPHSYQVAAGANLLDIAQHHDLEMEGACGGSCACSTCHVIVEDQKFYDRMPEPEDDENDMLDLAFGLTETSRLGCQVHMTKDLDGLVVRLPSMTRNLQQKDFEKKKDSG